MCASVKLKELMSLSGPSFEGKACFEMSYEKVIGVGSMSNSRCGLAFMAIDKFFNLGVLTFTTQFV